MLSHLKYTVSVQFFDHFLNWYVLWSKSVWTIQSIQLYLLYLSINSWVCIYLHDDLMKLLYENLQLPLYVYYDARKVWLKKFYLFTRGTEWVSLFTKMYWSNDQWFFWSILLSLNVQKDQASIRCHCDAATQEVMFVIDHVSKKRPSPNIS